MEERALNSLENPSTQLNCQTVDDLLDPSTGAPSSGMHVSPNTAWNYTAVYAAIRLLAETVAQLPLHLYRRSGETREKATEHDLYNVAANSPSLYQTSFLWRETQMAQCLTWGNGYAFLRKQGDRVIEIQVLPSPQVICRQKEDGTLVYQIINNQGRYFEAQPHQVLHIPAMSVDGIIGVSPITAHREALGLTAAAQAYGATFFGRGQSFGGVLTHPSGLSRQAKEMLKAGMETYRGKGYNGTLILDEGMDFKTMGIPPEDAQFLETRRFQVTEVARIYNIPPHMLRDLEKSSFNNIEQQGAEYLRYTMSPWLVKWEQELNRKLLTEEEQGEYYFKFASGGLLRGTQRDRYESYGRAILDGWMSRNEVRELEDLNPVDGLDDYLQPLNMAPVGEEVEEEAEEEAQEFPQDAEDMPPEEAEDAPEEDDEDEERARFGPLIRQAADSYANWLHKAKRENIVAKFESSTERYIYPVLLAAGVKDKAQWREYMFSIELDDRPSAREIAAQVERIIWGDSHG